MDNKSKNTFSKAEKQALKEDIFHSIHTLNKKAKRKILLKRLGYAAVLFLFLSTAVVFFLVQRNSGSDLQQFIQQSQGQPDYTNGEVTLILGKETLEIENDEDEVMYAANGASVRVGGKAIAQLQNNKNGQVFNTIIVPYGRRSKLTLSDGSQVWLNSGSRLIYPAAFSDENREVYLQGEAIFDVAHNKEKPFRVLSDKQQIEVLGTVFNVSVYPNDQLQQTVLQEGSVVLSYAKKDKEITLIPGQLSSYDSETAIVAVTEVNTNAYFSWREGAYTLNNTSLEEIVKKLSRYYNIPIIIQDPTLKKETFSGKLDLKEKVEDVLGIIQKTSNITINQNQTDSIIIN